MPVSYFTCDGDCGSILNDCSEYRNIELTKIGGKSTNVSLCDECANKVFDRCVPEISEIIVFYFEWKRPETCVFSSLLPKEMCTIVIDYYAPRFGLKIWNEVNYNNWCRLLKWLIRANKYIAVSVDINERFMFELKSEYKSKWLLYFWNTEICDLSLIDKMPVEWNIKKYCSRREYRYIASNFESETLAPLDTFIKNFVLWIKDSCDYESWFEIPPTVDNKRISILNEIEELNVKTMQLKRKLEQIDSSDEILFSKWQM